MYFVFDRAFASEYIQFQMIDVKYFSLCEYGNNFKCLKNFVCNARSVVLPDALL